MGSLSYACEGGQLQFTDEVEPPVNDVLRSRNLIKGWNAEQISVTAMDAAKGVGSTEPSLRNTTRKSILSGPCSKNSLYNTNGDPSESVQSISTVTTNSLVQFGARSSSYGFKSNDEKLLQTDLEIEKLGAPVVSNACQLSEENSALYSTEQSVSAKRARITNLRFQNPVCQVLGCNKDLSSSKDYHKRHKVCDIHSKSSVVIVNGTRQRFCQQCSRFQNLEAFDGNKRSCRRRLAGHNERRRKPQFGAHFGSASLVNDSTKAFPPFWEILPGGYINPRCNGLSNSSGHIMHAKEPNHLSQLAIPVKLDYSPTSLLQDMVKHYPTKKFLNAPLFVEELFAGFNSNYALSLLSASNTELFEKLISRKHDGASSNR